MQPPIDARERVKELVAAAVGNCLAQTVALAPSAGVQTNVARIGAELAVVVAAAAARIAVELVVAEQPVAAHIVVEQTAAAHIVAEPFAAACMFVAQTVAAARTVAEPFAAVRIAAVPIAVVQTVAERIVAEQTVVELAKAKGQRVGIGDRVGIAFSLARANHRDRMEVCYRRVRLISKERPTVFRCWMAAWKSAE